VEDARRHAHAIVVPDAALLRELEVAAGAAGVGRLRGRSDVLTGARGGGLASREDGVWHHQWKGVPTFIFQYSEVGQSAGDANILFPEQFATAELMRP